MIQNLVHVLRSPYPSIFIHDVEYASQITRLVPHSVHEPMNGGVQVDLPVAPES